MFQIFKYLTKRWSVMLHEINVDTHPISYTYMVMVMHESFLFASFFTMLLFIKLLRKELVKIIKSVGQRRPRSRECINSKEGKNLNRKNIEKKKKIEKKLYARL